MTPAAAVFPALLLANQPVAIFLSAQEVAERENMQQFFYQPRYEWFIFKFPLRF